jgi:hypothetical protein
MRSTALASKRINRHGACVFRTLVGDIKYALFGLVENVLYPLATGAIAGVGNRISRGDNAAKNRSIANDVCVMHNVCGAASVTRQLA